MSIYNYQFAPVYDVHPKCLETGNAWNYKSYVGGVPLSSVDTDSWLKGLPESVPGKLSRGVCDNLIPPISTRIHKSCNVKSTNPRHLEIASVLPVHFEKARLFSLPSRLHARDSLISKRAM